MKRGRTRHLQEKLPEQIVESWMRILKAKWCQCAPSRDWPAYTKCTHRFRMYVCKPWPWHWSTQDHHISDHSRHDINIKSREISVTKSVSFSSVDLQLSFTISFSSKNLCLRFWSVVLRMTCVYLLLPKPHWFSFFLMLSFLWNMQGGQSLLLCGHLSLQAYSNHL